MATNAPIRLAFEQIHREYWLRRYCAYVNDQELDESFLQSYAVDRAQLPQLPAKVQDAHQYYFENVEEKDFGVVRLHQVMLTDEQVYVIYVTTDGDDGWVELYSEEGTELSIGRLYLELVGWGTKKFLRGQTETGKFPYTLSNRTSLTLWGSDPSKTCSPWREANNQLKATFKFKDFIEAFSFMTEVAFHAEKMNHHPDWRNVWNTVEIALYTHDADNTISDKDRKLAAATEKVYERYKN